MRIDCSVVRVKMSEQRQLELESRSTHVTLVIVFTVRLHVPSDKTSSMSRKLWGIQGRSASLELERGRGTWDVPLGLLNPCRNPLRNSHIWADSPDCARHWSDCWGRLESKTLAGSVHTCSSLVYRLGWAKLCLHLVQAHRGNKSWKFLIFQIEHAL